MDRDKSSFPTMCAVFCEERQLNTRQLFPGNAYQLFCLYHSKGKTKSRQEKEETSIGRHEATQAWAGQDWKEEGRKELEAGKRWQGHGRTMPTPVPPGRQQSSMYSTTGWRKEGQHGATITVSSYVSVSLSLSICA